MRPPGPQRRPRPDDDEDEDEEEEEENGVPMDDQYADGEGDPCPNCGRVYRRAPCAGCRPLNRALCSVRVPVAAWARPQLGPHGLQASLSCHPRALCATCGARRAGPSVRVAEAPAACAQDGRVLDRVRLLRRLVRRQVRTGAPALLPRNARLAAALTVGSLSGIACACLPARSSRLTLFTLAASASRGCPFIAFVAVPSILQGCYGQYITPGAATASLRRRSLLHVLPSLAERGAFAGAQMTPGKAQRMGKWRCPACERKNV